MIVPKAIVELKITTGWLLVTELQNVIDNFYLQITTTEYSSKGSYDLTSLGKLETTLAPIAIINDQIPGTRMPESPTSALQKIRFSPVLS